MIISKTGYNFQYFEIADFKLVAIQVPAVEPTEDAKYWEKDEHTNSINSVS